MTRPESGPGAIAGIGTRLRAFVVDSLLSIAVALIAGFRPGDGGYALTVLGAFLVIELVFLSVAGQTPGMRLAGAAVVRATDSGRPSVGWIALRTLLLAAI